jgi:hypothetical protein
MEMCAVYLTDNWFGDALKVGQLWWMSSWAVALPMVSKHICNPFCFKGLISSSEGLVDHSIVRLCLVCIAIPNPDAELLDGNGVFLGKMAMTLAVQVF